MLNQRVALVTGSGTGIGKAIAENLGLSGSHVVVTDVNVQAAEDVAAGIRRNGGQASALAHDVSSEPSWTDLVADLIRRFGRWDVLVNNAGWGGPRTPLAQTPLEGWRQTFGVNLEGTFLGVRAALRSMSAGGAVVNISSLGAFVATPNHGAYAASKAAVVSLTRTAAKEAAMLESKIRFNAIAPGFVQTATAESIVASTFGPGPQILAQFVAAIPLGAGTPDDIARAAQFLLSPEARWITGCVMTVDGGMAP